MVNRKRKRNQSPEPSLEANNEEEYLDAASPKVDDDEQRDEDSLEELQPPIKKLRSGNEYANIFPEAGGNENEIDYATLELDNNNTENDTIENEDIIFEEEDNEENEPIVEETTTSRIEVIEEQLNQPKSPPTFYKQTSFTETTFSVASNQSEETQHIKETPSSAPRPKLRDDSKSFLPIIVMVILGLISFLFVLGLSEHDFRMRRYVTTLFNRVDALESAPTTTIELDQSISVEEIIAAVEEKIRPFILEAARENQQQPSVIEKTIVNEPIDMNASLESYFKKNAHLIRKMLHIKQPTINETSIISKASERISTDVSNNVFQKINNMIIRYVYEDGLGMQDFALSSMNSIIENYDDDNLYLSVKPRYTLWPTNYMKLQQMKKEAVGRILDQNNAPGNCWAINGSKSFVEIRLGEPIYPSQFTIQHISSLLSKDAHTAPKDIAVYGKEVNEDGTIHWILLGKHTYSTKNIMEQFTSLHSDQAFQSIRLDILSNHGAPKTCVYRFRVHGTPASKDSPFLSQAN